MPGRFDCFVILGAMRTGSNLLEESLGAYPGLEVFGEVFNPLFAGHEGQGALFGLPIGERDRDPLAMIARMVAQTEGTPGFRLFPGHDPRVLDHCLADARCAKVVLARNPADSYVSLKIARKTGQWWMGDVRTARSGTVRFEPAEFEDHLALLRDFYGHIRRALQTSGQTAFQIHYDDLSDPAVLDGLAGWLGATGPAEGGVKARVQNPAPLEDKVENFAEMEAALGRADAFDLFRLPDLEPRRGPNVPAWLGARTPGLIFMPLAGGPTARVAAWLDAAGGAPPASGFTRKSLRQWMRDVPDHRSFTVVTHPLRRAHDVFRERILSPGPDAFAEIRAVLRDRHGLDLPDEGDAPDRDRHRAAFLGFLRFLKANLAGQTSVRVPAAWASQAVLVRALSEVLAPDAILRAETLERDLPLLRPGLPAGPAADPAPADLAAIYDPEVEEAARAACARDYAAFGYGPWR
jgi:LPS sulfotransferase NodH